MECDDNGHFVDYDNNNNNNNNTNKDEVQSTVNDPVEESKPNEIRS